MSLEWALNPAAGQGTYIYLHANNAGTPSQVLYTSGGEFEALPAAGQYLYHVGGVLGLRPVGDTFSIEKSGGGYTIFDDTAHMYVNTPQRTGPPNHLTLSAVPTVWMAIPE